MASPYDALLEPDTKPSPYDALLDSTPKASPYDALLEPVSARNTVPNDPALRSEAEFITKFGLSNLGILSTTNERMDSLARETEDKTKDILGAFTGTGSLAQGNQIMDDSTVRLAQQAEALTQKPVVQKESKSQDILDNVTDAIGGVAKEVFRGPWSAGQGTKMEPGGINLKAATDFLVSPLTDWRDYVGEKVGAPTVVKDDLRSQPIVQLPYPSGDTASEGVVRSVANQVSGLSTGDNLTLLMGAASAPAVVQKLIAAGFSADMAHATAERVADLSENWDQMTPGERAEKTTDAVGSAAITILTGAHALKARPKTGGLTPEEVKAGGRADGLTPEQADSAATKNQLRTITRGVDENGSLLPEKVYQGDAKSEDREALEGIALSYAKQSERLKSAPEDKKPAIQEELDRLDQQLMQFDVKDAYDALAKARLPGEVPEQVTPAAPTEALPAPEESAGPTPSETSPPVEDTTPVKLPTADQAARALFKHNKTAVEAARAAGATDPEMAASEAMTRLTDAAVEGKVTLDNPEALMVKAARDAARNQLDKANAEKRGGGNVGSLDTPVDEGDQSIADTVASPEASPSDLAEMSDQAKAVRAVVERLPEHLRATAKAKLENPDASNTEIAKQLGVSTTTVGNHLKAMAEHFEDLRNDETLQCTDAPHSAPVAGNVTPKIKTDIGPGSLGIRPPIPPFLDKITDVLAGISDHPSVSDFAKAFRGWIGGLAGKTFPKLTALNRELGELGARWISSRTAAKPSADLFSSKVLEGLDVDPLKFGAALHEDNLRSVRKGFEDAGNTDAAASVNTIIGGKGSPFKTETDYQNFLNDPKTRQAIDRHKALWEQIVDPQYKQAMSIDPDEVLPSRGLQTGARINLNPLQEGVPAVDKVFTVGRGNLLGTLRKKSQFGQSAKGTGTGYGMNYLDIMRNTFGKQLEIANKNKFEDALVEKGFAKVEQPGQPIEINGREGEPYPYKRQTLILKNGQPLSQSRSIYIDPRFKTEYEIAANVQKNPFSSKYRLVPDVISKLNQAALAGLTDATVHVSNLATALFTRSGTSGGLISDTLLSALGRADVPVSMVKALVKGFKNNDAQIKELSEIGAMRDQHEAGRIPGLRQMSQLIQWADKTVRLSLDDAFQRMAKDGIVEDTETNRREFVNQVGQYNKRAQGVFTRFARDSGLAPFVTAGKTFNALGVRTALLDTGAKATSVPAAMALKGNQLAKWVGAAGLIATTNYLITGKTTGRPGVPIGGIDTGKDDKNGRPLYIKASDILGIGRALRVTGARGAIEAKRGGLTNQDALDSATRDIINSATAPWQGPAIHFAATSAGLPTAIGVGRPAPVAAPGESQRWSDIKHALIQASPAVASIVDRFKTGGSLMESMQRQLPRYLPQSGKSAEFMEKYPQIVHKAQASNFIDDVIKQARNLEPEARKALVEDAKSRLDKDDVKQLLTRLKYRHVEVK